MKNSTIFDILTGLIIITFVFGISLSISTDLPFKWRLVGNGLAIICAICAAIREEYRE